MVVSAEWYGDRVKKSIAAACLDAANKVLMLAEDNAKKLCPVDTGRLRASITHEIKKVNASNIIGRVGTNVGYASHVEYGTFKQRAQPYLRPGIDKALDKSNTIFEAEIAKAI